MYFGCFLTCENCGDCVVQTVIGLVCYPPLYLVPVTNQITFTEAKIYTDVLMNAFLRLQTVALFCLVFNSSLTSSFSLGSGIVQESRVSVVLERYWII